MVFGVCETFVFWRNIFLLIGVSVTFGHPQAARLGSARLTRTARPTQFLCTRPWRAEILSSRPGPRNFCPHGPCTLLSMAPSTRQIRRIFVHAPGLRRLIRQLSY